MDLLNAKKSQSIHVWILKKTRFQTLTLCYLQDLHLWMAEFLSTRPGPGRWFERATVSGSLWHARAAGGHTGMDISIGEREHLNRKPWFSPSNWMEPIQCIFWGMTFISTSYFRVDRNVSRLLPTASFSWIQLFVYLEDLDPAKLYGMYVQKNIP